MFNIWRWWFLRLFKWKPTWLFIWMHYSLHICWQKCPQCHFMHCTFFYNWSKQHATHVKHKCDYSERVYYDWRVWLTRKLSNISGHNASMHIYLKGVNLSSSTKLVIQWFDWWVYPRALVNLVYYPYLFKMMDREYKGRKLNDDG